MRLQNLVGSKWDLVLRGEKLDEEEIMSFRQLPHNWWLCIRWNILTRKVGMIGVYHLERFTY